MRKASRPCSSCLLIALCVCSKSVGVRLALSEVLRTARKALAQIPSLELPFDAHEDDPRLPIRFFTRAWLGLAGVGEKSDADEMRSLAGDAFGFAVDDPALRITNGKLSNISHLPCRFLNQRLQTATSWLRPRSLSRTSAPPLLSSRARAASASVSWSRFLCILQTVH